MDGSQVPGRTRIEIDHRTPSVRHPEKAHRPDNPIRRKPDFFFFF